MSGEGLLIETLTPPSFMIGGSYQIFKIDFSGADSFGMDIGLSIGRTIALEGLFFPVGRHALRCLWVTGARLL